MEIRLNNINKRNGTIWVSCPSLLAKLQEIYFGSGLADSNIVIKLFKYLK
jgi:hypothetical protein